MGGVAARRDESPLSAGSAAIPRLAPPKNKTRTRPNGKVRFFIFVSPSSGFFASRGRAFDVFDKFLVQRLPRLHQSAKSIPDIDRVAVCAKTPCHFKSSFIGEEPAC